MDKDYLVKKKREDGKYFTYGSVKKNKFNNYQLGLKVTPELRELLAGVDDGSWINLNLFESQPKQPDDVIPF